MFKSAFTLPVAQRQTVFGKEIALQTVFSTAQYYFCFAVIYNIKETLG